MTQPEIGGISPFFIVKDVAAAFCVLLRQDGV
jgi:hypothetical protein